MRFAFVWVGLSALSLLSGCISVSSHPSPPASNTTVVVPSHYSDCPQGVDAPC